MGEVNEKTLVVVDLQGRKLEGGLNEEPSKEIYFHLAVYRARDDVASVFHLHPPCATAFAACSAEIPLLTVSAQVKLRKVPLVSFARPGSSELANLVSSEILKHDKSLNSLLLEKHGIVTWSGNVADAFYAAELLEETAKIALNARLLGR
jgi:L-fuculose-phosphate aldolase